MSIAHIVAEKAAQAVAGSLIKAGISHFRSLKEGSRSFHGDIKSIAADFGMTDRLDAIQRILPDADRDPADKLTNEGRAAFLRARDRLLAMGGRTKEAVSAVAPMSAEKGREMAALYNRGNELLERAFDTSGIDRRALIQSAIDTTHEMKMRLDAMRQRGMDTKPFVHAHNFLDENINALIARTREPKLTLSELHEQSARIAINETAAPASSTLRNKV